MEWGPFPRTLATEEGGGSDWECRGGRFALWNPSSLPVCLTPQIGEWGKGRPRHREDGNRRQGWSWMTTFGSEQGARSLPALSVSIQLCNDFHVYSVAFPGTGFTFTLILCILNPSQRGCLISLQPTALLTPPLPPASSHLAAYPQFLPSSAPSYFIRSQGNNEDCFLHPPGTAGSRGGECIL